MSYELCLPVRSPDASGRRRELCLPAKPCEGESWGGCGCGDKPRKMMFDEFYVEKIRPDTLTPWVVFATE
jgi:hypothetical protein